MQSTKYGVVLADYFRSRRGTLSGSSALPFRERLFVGSCRRVHHKTKRLKLVRFTGFQATTRNNAQPKDVR